MFKHNRIIINFPFNLVNSDPIEDIEAVSLKVHAIGDPNNLFKDVDVHFEDCNRNFRVAFNSLIDIVEFVEDFATYTTIRKLSTI